MVDDFHEGIIGIVAGRMKELYNRPVCIIAINQNGVGKGIWEINSRYSLRGNNFRSFKFKYN